MSKHMTTIFIVLLLIFSLALAVNNAMLSSKLATLETSFEEYKEYIVNCHARIGADIESLQYDIAQIHQ